MVKTFALVNGDLAIDGDGQYLMFSGSARIRQDLQLALTEEYGSDRFHPKWGSTVKQYLGFPVTGAVTSRVKAEVNRVVHNYVTLQKAEVLRDSVVDVKGRFDTSDVVRFVQSIEATPTWDAIQVQAKLQTVNRETITISRQVTS